MNIEIKETRKEILKYPYLGVGKTETPTIVLF